MIIKLWNRKHFALLKTIQEYTNLPEEVTSQVNTYLETLNYYYNPTRELSEDGGFILLATSLKDNIQKEQKKWLHKFHVSEDDMEYRECITIERQKWFIELFIITNDYGIVFIYPTAKGEL